VSVSVAVMAHPKRRRFVEELLPRLDREAEVVWDRENDRWETGRRSLMAFDSSATHHLVIQDDAIPCRDLVAGTEEAVKFSGERPLGLYVSWATGHVASAVRRARDGESSWLQMEGPWWGPAVVIPTAQIPELVEWGDKRPDIANYDRRITRFYGFRRVECWYSLPSLVDHRPGDENPSLVEGRTATNRVAQWFIGADASALDIDWSKPPLEIDIGERAIFRHAGNGVEKAVPLDSLAYKRMIATPQIWELVKQGKRKD